MIGFTKNKLIKKIEKYLQQEFLEENILFTRCDTYPTVMPDMCMQQYSPIPSEGMRENQPAKKTLRAGKGKVGNIQEKSLCIPEFSAAAIEVERYIDESLEQTTFAKKLNQYMFEKNLTTAAIYRRCMVDRKLISKITTQAAYHPSKSTVFALCIGLQLTLSQGEEFLSLAGFSFNQSSKYDLIIKFMLQNEIYDLDTINEMLIHFNQPCFE